jgi:transposase
MVDRLDLSELERQYSSLGRRGLHPGRKLAVLLYASLTGLHECSKIAKAIQTDAAYRLLTGGHDISQPV